MMEGVVMTPAEFMLIRKSLWMTEPRFGVAIGLATPDKSVRKRQDGRQKDFRRVSKAVEERIDGLRELTADLIASYVRARPGILVTYKKDADFWDAHSEYDEESDYPLPAQWHQGVVFAAWQQLPGSRIVFHDEMDLLDERGSK
jgi:hypothetical protein